MYAEEMQTLGGQVLEERKIEFRKNILEKACTFVFARHGKTDWSETDLKKGPMNYALNEDGFEETSRMAEMFGELCQDCEIYYVSPLTRAMHTAQIYQGRAPLKIEIKIVPELEEFRFGDHSTLTDEEIANKVHPLDRESDDHFAARVMKGVLRSCIHD